MQVLREKFGGRTDYNIYIPDNVNEDTEVLFYTINTSYTKEMENDIIKNNGDSIVIVPENSPIVVGNETGGHKFQTEAIKAFDFVKEKYNLQTEQFSQAGFSSGYGPSIRTMADYIKSNPNAGRQIIISVDGCKSANATGETIYNSEYQTLKENNTIIISYSQKYRQQSEINFLKKAGLPILFVVDPDIPENSSNRWGYYHGVVANNFTERGLYESLLNFAQGKDELPDGYIYQMYDPKTKKITTIDPADAANYLNIKSTFEYKLDKLLSLSTVSLQNLSLSTNTDILQQPFNDIIGNIKSTSYLRSSQSNLSFSSTTNFPKKVPDLARMHFETTVELLYKLSKDMKEFAKIGPLIDKIQIDLDNDAVQLSEKQNSTVDVAPVTLSADVSNEKTVEKEKTDSSNKQVVLDNGTMFNTGGSGAFASFFSKLFKKDNASKQVEPLNTQTETLTNTSNTLVEESVPKIEEEQPVTISADNSQKEYSYSGGNYYSNNSSNNEIVNQEVNPLDEFPKYEEVYSDDTKIVYNYNDEYKIIVHKDGDNIIGIEHYYDFKTENNALSALDSLKTEYTNIENTENIVQQGRYVKVIFNENMYDNLTINDIKDKYSDLSEIFKI